MSQSELVSISNDGSYLAISTSNSLKLWETSSGHFEHELLPGQYLSSVITCIHFSPKVKQKSLAQTPDVSNFKIALGSNNGDILVYDIAKQKVVTRIKHDENSPVNCLKWPYSKLMVSLGEKKLVAWSKKHVKLWEVSYGGTSFCSLHQNKFMIGSTSLRYVNYTPNKISTYASPAHKTSITILVPVMSSNMNNCAKYVLSASFSERFIYAWQATTGEMQEPIATLMVKDRVQTISCKTLNNDFVAILVTTAQGFMRYFYYHFNGRNNTKPLKYVSSLHVETPGDDSSTLPILTASFISSQEILIVYGTILFPCCERVSIDSLKDDITLVRQDPSRFLKKKSGLVKTIVPEEKESTIHFAPTVMKHPKMEEFVSQKTQLSDDKTDSSMPMETRLDALSPFKSKTTFTDGCPIDSYVHLLTQALHSQDSSLLNTILSKGEDEEVIDNTIRSLPLHQVVPFLKYLQDYVQTKGLKNLTCVKWIKSLLYHHMSLLSSLPTKKQLLDPFHTLLSARMDSFLAVAKLQSRLDMLLTRVKSRHQNLMQDSTKEKSQSLLHYKDDSSDDEYILGGLELEGGPSESEDIWDDWTEDDDDDDENMEKETRTPSNKRKLSEEDDAISISDSGDEGGLPNGSMSSEEEDQASSRRDDSAQEKATTSKPSSMGTDGDLPNSSSEDSENDESESLSD